MSSSCSPSFATKRSLTTPKPLYTDSVTKLLSHRFRRTPHLPKTERESNSKSPKLIPPKLKLRQCRIASPLKLSSTDTTPVVTTWDWGSLTTDLDSAYNLLETMSLQHQSLMSLLKEDQDIHKELLLQLKYLKDLKCVLNYNYELVMERDQKQNMLKDLLTSVEGIAKEASKTQTNKDTSNVPLEGDWLAVDLTTRTTEVVCFRCGRATLLTRSVKNHLCSECKCNPDSFPQDNQGSLAVETQMFIPPHILSKLINEHAQQSWGAMVKVAVHLPSSTALSDRLSSLPGNTDDSPPLIPKLHASDPSATISSFKEICSKSLSSSHTAKSICMDISSKLTDQLLLRDKYRFPKFFHQQCLQDLSYYSRSLRTLLRGLQEVLPIHAIGVERCFRGVIHLCELAFQHQELKITDFEARVQTLQADTTEKLQLRLEIKQLEGKLLLQNSELHEKLRSQGNTLVEYEKLLTLCYKELEGKAPSEESGECE